VLAWAGQQTGEPYVYGANGPDAWDCSSFTQAAYRQAGLSMPRTAGAQRDWLAAGAGTRIPPGQERPGDLIFWDSYLGPNAIGHVVIVKDPTTRTTVEAKSTRAGVGTFTYRYTGHSIFEIWRPGTPTGEPDDHAGTRERTSSPVRRDVARPSDAADHTPSPYFAHGRLDGTLDPLRQKLALLAQHRPDLYARLADHFDVTATLMTSPGG
jgi:hypothetical protein